MLAQDMSGPNALGGAVPETKPALNRQLNLNRTTHTVIGVWQYTLLDKYQEKCFKNDASPPVSHYHSSLVHFSDTAAL